MAKIAFKSDNQQQSYLFPPRLEDLIPETHSVRVVNSIIDQLDIKELLTTYKGGGNSCFHPRVMLKVIVYAYLNNIYSSRRIEQQIQENIHYMWLAGGSCPDFRTINYFRGKRLKDKFDNIFTQVVELLHQEGFVSLQVQYIDGTKIESASNKYGFVWRGSVEKYDAKLKEKTRLILRQIEESVADELKENPIPEPITVDEFHDRVERIKQNIDTAKAPKETVKLIETLEKENLPKMKQYKQHLDTMGDRNSYAKSDTDATFMRMKEDAMNNGQLKPGYNVQISTENQFITNYGIYQQATDTGTLIDFLKSFESRYSIQSLKIVADAGYGSEQNYNYMFSKGMIPFVKYNYFHQEQKIKVKTNPFLSQNLYYNSSDDYYVCPMGQKMRYVYGSSSVSKLGYISHHSNYQAECCYKCPLRGSCFKADGNRIISVNTTLNRYKEKVRELLTSDEGLYHRSMRPIEPESVFGQIKSAHLFRRFLLRTIKGVNLEFGLVALAHNIRKIASKSCRLAGVLLRILTKIRHFIDYIYDFRRNYAA